MNQLLSRLIVLCTCLLPTLVDATPPAWHSVADIYAAHQPLAWWRLHESPREQTAADVTNRFNGKYRIVHRAFDGEGSHVRLGTVDVDSKAISILAFFQPNDFGQSDARIISKANGTNSQDHYWMLSTVEAQGKHRLRFRLRAGHRTHELVATQGDLQAGKWHFAAGTYDGRTIRLYLDGREVAKQTAKGRVATNSHCEVWIGDNPSGQGSRPFDGRIEDVALFDHALDPRILRGIAETRIRRPDEGDMLADAASSKPKDPSSKSTPAKSTPAKVEPKPVPSPPAPFVPETDPTSELTPKPPLETDPDPAPAVSSPLPPPAQPPAKPPVITIPAPDRTPAGPTLRPSRPAPSQVPYVRQQSAASPAHTVIIHGTVFPRFAPCPQCPPARTHRAGPQRRRGISNYGHSPLRRGVFP